jgi:plastocyanin
VRRLGLALALCAALVAGCRDDDGDGDSRAVTVKRGEALRVVAHEYEFDPSRVAALGAGELTITLRNAGALAHNLKILRGERDLGGTPTFQGGRVRSGTVTLERGRYDMVCTVGNHAELGMVGILQVK